MSLQDHRTLSDCIITIIYVASLNKIKCIIGFDKGTQLSNCDMGPYTCIQRSEHTRATGSSF